METTILATNGSGAEKPLAATPAAEPPAATAAATEPVAKPDAVVAKPVNPLRLARPLEKVAQGLSKTAIPPTRPMPMPTISPLCPPGSTAAKNGIKGLATGPPKNGPALEAAKPVVPISQPLKATTPQAKEEEKPQESAKPVAAAAPAKETVVPEKKLVTPPKVAAPAKPAETAVQVAPPMVPPKKAVPPAAAPSPKEEEEEEVPAPTSLPEAQPLPKPASPQKSPDGPKVPVAEKTPRQKKRKASQEVAPLPDDEKRLSKRARAPPAIYESPDPDMAQILKTIKKQEEDDKRATSASDKEEEKPKPKAKNKPKLLPPRRQPKKNMAEESDSDLDEPPRSKPTPKSRVKKSKPEASIAPKKKGGDPVFFKSEYIAVRNPEGSFYICKAMQNIYLGSKNINIQWLSNEDPIVPAKDNPDNDIYAHDFYDKTDFETILTSVELEKTLGRSKRMVLPEEELERINKILQRANDKAAGKLDVASLLTEDNPDGLDISLYKGENQLDEIDRKRKGDEKVEKRVVRKKEVKQRVEKEVKDEIDFKPEAKKRAGRGKEKATEKADSTEKKAEAPKRERRATTNPVSYDQSTFDFLEEEDDEVIPVPKKRKSQDSVAEETKPAAETATVSPEVQTEKKKELEESKPEVLSTSEKAALAEKAKMESEQKEKEEESTTTSDGPAKKRGRKTKN